VIIQSTRPSLGINETFSGGTRDANNNLFEDYIKQNGEATLRELPRVSAVDPLAGNPTSVQSRMVVGDYDAGYDTMYNPAAPGSALGIDLRFCRYGLEPFTQNVYTPPLSYTYTFSNHDVLMVRMPLTYIEVAGATADRGMLGLSYKKVLGSRWALTPAPGYGIAGSADRGPRTAWTHIVCIPDQRPPTFVTGTWFFGDALYTTKYQEFGISIGPRRRCRDRCRNRRSNGIFAGAVRQRQRGRPLIDLLR